MKILSSLSLVSIMLAVLSQELHAMERTKKRSYEESAIDSNDLLVTTTSSKHNKIEPQTITTAVLPCPISTDSTEIKSRKQSPGKALENPGPLKRQHNSPVEESAPLEATFENLVKAIQANDTDSVKKLIELEASLITAKDSNGLTALHWAAESGSTECLQKLITKGANIEASDNTGSTPLHFAANRGHVRCLQILIDEGANIEAKDKAGNRPLHFVAGQGHANCLQILIDNGANLQAIDIGGRTPLHFTAQQGHSNCLQNLIDKRANLEAQDEYGCTPLHLAAIKGHTSCLQILIDKGANKEATTNDGNTSLLISAGQGRANCLQILLDQGANRETKGSACCSAFELACTKENFECVKVFVLSTHLPEDFAPFTTTLENGKKVAISYMLEELSIFKTMRNDAEPTQEIELKITEELWKLLNKNIIDLYVLSHIRFTHELGPLGISVKGVKESMGYGGLSEASKKILDLAEELALTHSAETIRELLYQANRLGLKMLVTIAQYAYALREYNDFLERLDTTIIKDLREPIKTGLIYWVNRPSLEK